MKPLTDGFALRLQRIGSELASVAAGRLLSGACLLGLGLLYRFGLLGLLGRLAGQLGLGLLVR